VGQALADGGEDWRPLPANVRNRDVNALPLTSPGDLAPERAFHFRQPGGDGAAGSGRIVLLSTTIKLGDPLGHATFPSITVSHPACRVAHDNDVAGGELGPICAGRRPTRSSTALRLRL
jgi:hypothetical protein